MKYCDMSGNCIQPGENHLENVDVGESGNVKMRVVNQYLSISIPPGENDLENVNLLRMLI